MDNNNSHTVPHQEVQNIIYPFQQPKLTCLHTVSQMIKIYLSYQPLPSIEERLFRDHDPTRSQPYCFPVRHFDARCLNGYIEAARLTMVLLMRWKSFESLTRSRNSCYCLFFSTSQKSISGSSLRNNIVFHLYR